MIQASTNTTINKTKDNRQEDEKQDSSKKSGANFFMCAIEEVYESDDEKYHIICTQDSVVVDYNHIAHQTTDNQMIQDFWFLLDDCTTITVYNPHLMMDIH